MAQQTINISTPNSGLGDTAYVAFGKVNANFTELYNATSIPVLLSNQTGAITKAISAKTNVKRIFIGIQSGNPSIKCGTTVGGNDVFDTIAYGSMPIGLILEKFYPTSGTLYFTISGGNVNIQIDLETVTI